MAKNDQQEAFERLLSSTLSRTIDFVKFAEAKNGALLAFSSAWIAGSINFINSTGNTDSQWKIPFAIALPIFSCAAVISIASFLPKTNILKFHRDPDQSKSLLYFGDASTFPLLRIEIAS